MATMKFNISSKNQVISYSIIRDNSNEVWNTKIREKNKQMVAYQRLYFYTFSNINIWNFFFKMTAWIDFFLVLFGTKHHFITYILIPELWGKKKRSIQWITRYAWTTLGTIDCKQINLGLNSLMLPWELYSFKASWKDCRKCPGSMKEMTTQILIGRIQFSQKIGKYLSINIFVLK